MAGGGGIFRIRVRARAQGKRTRLEIWTPYAASMASDVAHTRAAEDDSPDPVPPRRRSGAREQPRVCRRHTCTGQIQGVSSHRHALTCPARLNSTNYSNIVSGLAEGLILLTHHTAAE